MTETRDERVVRMAAAFPWAEHNSESERPLTPFRVMQTDSIASELRQLEREGATFEELQALAGEVARLVNERPADPFDGIAP